MKNILCFGDSNTWGYDFTTYDPALGSGQRLPFDERWPGIVQNMLGADYRIIEDALNARTNMVEDPYFPHRLGLASLETALDAHAPLDLVIIQMGVNELKHMFNLTAGMISFGVEKLVAGEAPEEDTVDLGGGAKEKDGGLYAELLELSRSHSPEEAEEPTEPTRRIDFDHLQFGKDYEIK